jgi:RNA 2',3'-cyclic 3'-phosphodiesterase
VLARALPDLPALRKVAPELMHVTLAFLGAVEEDRVPRVVDAARAAAAGNAPFDIDVTGLGRFPQHGPPRTLWAGVDARAADAVVRTGAAVRAELLRHGVPFDPKPLRAHITLARVREGAGAEDARAVAAALAAARIPALRFRAAAIHVMESALGRGGPRYTSRAAVPLVGRAG